MELVDLKVLLTIFKEGNITRAAAKMDYVQSNLSTRIRKLEAELGVQLFDRSPQGVVPTEKGLILCQYASDILHMVEEAVQSVQEPSYPYGPLAIGVVETMASSPLFIQALSEFQSKYPEVSLSLITGTSRQNYEKALGRELDGGFLSGEFDLSSMQIAYQVREEVFLLTAANGQEKGASADISNASWIVFPKGCPLRAATEEWLQSKGVGSSNMIEVSTLDTMLHCVRAGIGNTLLTESVIDAEDKRIEAHPVPESYRFMTTYLIARKERFSSKAFAAFADCLGVVSREATGQVHHKPLLTVQGSQV